MACVEAADRQTEKKTLAMFLRTDGAECSGVMLNYVDEPGRPLFYIANHCYTPATCHYVFYFNNESPDRIGDTGQTLQTVMGATLLASNYYNDFTMLELAEAPQDLGYDVFYTGWDSTDAIPLMGTVIHHPALDVKKISFDLDTLTEAVDIVTYLWELHLDTGVVEAGSSGAPLFDQNKHGWAPLRRHKRLRHG